MNKEVFISYRRDTGKDIASSFNIFLESNGIKPYFDLDSKYTGDFESNIKQAVKECDLFLILITEGSLERFENENDISRKEVEYAFEFNKSILPITLIGERAFSLMKNSDVECLHKISKLNTRFYTHETQTDTLNYVLDLVNELRLNRFKSKFELMSHEYALIVKGQESVTNYKLNKSLVFSGILRDSMPYGDGTVRNMLNSKKYEINFVGSNDYYGIGREFEGSTLVYEGEFVNFEYSGMGVLHHPDYTYQGFFLNGKPSVKGKIIYKDGSFYEGHINEGKPQGFGYQRTADGHEYRGAFVEGRRHGFGTFIHSNGNTFEGSFENNSITKGYTLSPNKKIFNAPEFDEDLKPLGKTKAYDLETQETIFDGLYKDGKMNGEGVLNLKGSAVKKLSIPSRIEGIDFTTPINPSQTYTLEGTFEENRFIFTKPFKLSDLNGKCLIKCKKHKDYEYLEGMIKYYIFQDIEYLEINESNKNYTFLLNDGKLNLLCKFRVNDSLKSDKLIVPKLVKGQKLIGILEDKEYEIEEIITELPLLIKDKLGVLKDNQIKKEIQGDEIQI